MSFDTYTNLKLELADWLHRDDLTSKIPTFIQLGEARLNRNLRTVDMETRATASMTVGNRYLALPSGFLEMVTLVNTDTDNDLIFIDPDTFSTTDDTTEPFYFTVKDELVFNSLPDSAYALEMHYFKKYDLATTETNWLLTDYPEAYLYSSIMAAQIYMMGDDRLPNIKALLDEAINEINKQEGNKRGKASLRVDASLMPRRLFNIINGN